MSSPLSIFQKALFWISLVSSRRFKNEPGAVIKSLSDKDRQVLSGLSSDELVTTTHQDSYWKDIVSTVEYEDNLKYKQSLVDFDKKILK